LDRQEELVEPGVARTEFGGASAVLCPPLDVYADGPSSQLRASLAGKGPALPAPGDPTKMARAIIASADQPEAVKRLTLGSDADDLATAALRERLEALENAKDLAYSTDADDYITTRARHSPHGLLLPYATASVIRTATTR
jgi:hypothetical protein